MPASLSPIPKEPTLSPHESSDSEPPNQNNRPSTPPHRGGHQYLPTLQASRLSPRRNQPACRTHSLRRISRLLLRTPPHPAVNHHHRKHRRQHSSANPDYMHTDSSHSNS